MRSDTATLDTSFKSVKPPNGMSRKPRNGKGVSERIPRPIYPPYLPRLAVRRINSLSVLIADTVANLTKKTVLFYSQVRQDTYILDRALTIYIRSK